MDLRAILNDVDDDGSPWTKGGAEEAHIHTTESHDGLSYFIRLPSAVQTSIISHLPNRDIKSLRLTCTFFHSIARLRLQRVFLSAHQRDIKVLHAIADSETFRHGITELIWDDTRFISSSHLTPSYNEINEYKNSAADSDDGGQVPEWFTNERHRSIKDLKRRRGLKAHLLHENDAQDEQLSKRLRPAACWEYYQVLLRQQNAVLASGADEAAFRHALQRFPWLQSVTITPAAHGWLFSPVYETPTIRAMPHGFIYPMPRGWPTVRDGWALSMQPWPDDDGDADGEAYKDQWRGVRVAIRVLAEPQTHHAVTVLVLTAHHLDTGLNCRIFEGPASSAEYANLCALLRRPHFARLDLALAVGGQEEIGWPAFRGGGHLRAALACAPGVRHFALRTNVELSRDMKNHVPLLDIIPVRDWTRLRHFGLSGFLVTQGDVAGLLQSLPSSLRSVELSFLQFLGGSGSWRDLLREMRRSPGWRDKEPACRPAVVVGHGRVRWPITGLAVWADRKAVGGFLYGDGPNPFGDEKRVPYKSWDQPGLIVVENEGCVERDAFHPAYERPYVDDSTLMTLGIDIKPGPP